MSKETRAWRLVGYAPGEDGKEVVVHQSTCRGDANLNDALHALEARRPDLTRFTVAPA